jgi:ubiquinone/menaquinone biosynthesis C-methylase UbiE
MLALARENAAVHPCGERVQFLRSDAKELPYADACFDAVISNSLLHHLEDPLPFLNAVARVIKPGGAIVFRDIRRPPGGLYWAWWRWFGRYYHGQMLASYQASLRAAFTPRELQTIVASSQLRACRVVSAPLTHISIVRMCTAGL